MLQTRETFFGEYVLQMHGKFEETGGHGPWGYKGHFAN